MNGIAPVAFGCGRARFREPESPLLRRDRKIMRNDFFKLWVLEDAAIGYIQQGETGNPDQSIDKILSNRWNGA